MPGTTRGQRAAKVPGPVSPQVPPPPPEPFTPAADPAPEPQQQPVPEQSTPYQPAAQQFTPPQPAAPVHVPQQPPSTQFANMQTNSAQQPPRTTAGAPPNGGGLSVSLQSMMGGGVDPEQDLHNENARLPRYYKNAIDAALRLHLFRHSTPGGAPGKPFNKQDLARAAWTAILPPELLDEAYRTLYGRERPQ